MSKDSIKKTALEKLQDKLYRTKSARFNADERLRAERKLANFSLMFLAIYIIALSSASSFESMSWLKVDNTAFYSLILSVVLLGIAALEAGNNRLEKAIRLHENALKINNIYIKSLAGSEDGAVNQKVEALSKEYAIVLSECHFNHSEIDILRNSISNTHLGFWIKFFSFIGWALLLIKHCGFYLATILLPSILFIILT